MIVAAMDLDPRQSVLNRRTIRIHAVHDAGAPHSPLHTSPNADAAANIVATSIARAMRPASRRQEEEVALIVIDGDRSATQRAAWRSRRPLRLRALAARLASLGLENEADIARVAREPETGEPTGYVETIIHEPHACDVDLTDALARLYANAGTP